MLKKIKGREVIFAAVSLVMAVILGGVFIYAINFLVQEIQTALNGDSSKYAQATQFNLAGLKDLGISKDNSTGQPADEASGSQPSL